MRTVFCEDGMKRLFISTTLYPLLGLAIFVASDRYFAFGWMLAFAYLFGIMPGLTAATVDAVLGAKPIYLRMTAAAFTGALALLNEMIYFEQSLSSGSTFLLVSLIGGIPAAVCSWLSSERQNSGLNELSGQK